MTLRSWRYWRLILAFLIVVASTITATSAMAAGLPTALIKNCQINGESSPRDLDVDAAGLNYGQFQNVVLLSRVKTRGSTCNLKFDRVVNMIIDSSQGTITLDGRPVPGNKTLQTGQHLVVVYNPGNGSNGFLVTIEVPEDVVIQAVVALAAPVAQVVAAPPPAQVGGELRGSCTMHNRQYNLRVSWDHPDGARADMNDEMVAAGKAVGKGNKVPCNYHTDFDAIIQIGDPKKDWYAVVAGTDKSFDVEGGDGFGFAIQTSYKSAAQTSTAATFNLGPGVPDPGGWLRGSCTINGIVYDLLLDRWHPVGPRLYMHKTFVEALEASPGEHPCMFASPRPATVEIGEKPWPTVPGGKAWYFNVKGGPGSGWAVQDS